MGFLPRYHQKNSRAYTYGCIFCGNIFGGLFNQQPCYLGCNFFKFCFGNQYYSSAKIKVVVSKMIAGGYKSVAAIYPVFQFAHKGVSGKNESILTGKKMKWGVLTYEIGKDC